MPPKLAMPAMAPMAAGGSRTEAKPILRASKEWVVPPRPKPGRKSTKTEAEQAKATGRTSQKAFRERRQEYVTELEEKVRQLEAGEGEKCVFYQQQAQKAKLETSALKTENDGLKKIIDQLRRELDVTRGRTVGGGKDKGKGRAVPVEFEEDFAPGPSKRPRRSAAVRAQAVVASVSGSSPHPMLSGDSPLPALSPPSTTSASSIASSFVHSPLNDNHPVGPASPAHGRCGFCASSADCFCTDVGYHIVSSNAAPISMPSPMVKIEEPDDVYYNEQTYEPAVPLRLRKSANAAPTVWAIQSAVPVSTKPALCNGDPSNCPACSDDPFGKAFCNALSSTVCSNTPCENCPGNCSSRRINTPPPDEADEEAALFASLTDLPCCGDPALCGSLTCKPGSETVKEEPKEVEMLPKTVLPGIRSAESMPCNEAWSALKQHPNIAFADLAMLADVVAKRTTCGGPVPTPSPPVPSATLSASSQVIDDSFDASRQLVPQSTLQCSIDAGARKRLTVERGAVNEALELLDRAVARGGPLRQ